MDPINSEQTAPANNRAVVSSNADLRALAEAELLEYLFDVGPASAWPRSDSGEGPLSEYP